MRYYIKYLILKIKYDELLRLVDEDFWGDLL